MGSTFAGALSALGLMQSPQSVRLAVEKFASGGVWSAGGPRGVWSHTGGSAGAVGFVVHSISNWVWKILPLVLTGGQGPMCM